MSRRRRPEDPTQSPQNLKRSAEDILCTAEDDEPILGSRSDSAKRVRLSDVTSVNSNNSNSLGNFFEREAYLSRLTPEQRALRLQRTTYRFREHSLLPDQTAVRKPTTTATATATTTATTSTTATGTSSEGVLKITKHTREDEKQRLVARILCRWWYCYPEMVRSEDAVRSHAEKELAARNKLKLGFKEFYQKFRAEGAPAVSASERRRCVFELGQFAGCYRTAEGDLLDLRPSPRCTYAYLWKQTAGELHERLKQGLHAQGAALEKKIEDPKAVCNYLYDMQLLLEVEKEASLEERKSPKAQSPKAKARGGKE